jgi:hypothetical protein
MVSGMIYIDFDETFTAMIIKLFLQFFNPLHECAMVIPIFRVADIHYGYNLFGYQSDTQRHDISHLEALLLIAI